MIFTQVAGVKYMIAYLECLNELYTELRKIFGHTNSSTFELKVHVSKIRRIWKLPVQLYMNKLHHYNQWNTNFLLIRYNRFTYANLCMFLGSKTKIRKI